MPLGHLLTVVFLVSAALAALIPPLAHAHEVYVLPAGDIARAMTQPPMPISQVIGDNLHQFIFWAFLSSIVVTTIFFMSISHVAERMLLPLFHRIKAYAPFVLRISFGMSLLASAYNQALFGPELPLASLFGPLASIITGAVAVSGILVLFGAYTRVAMLIVVLVFVFGVLRQGIYMLTYAEYLDAFAMFFIGEGLVRHAKASTLQEYLSAVGKRLRPYRFAILRVLFGIALMFASIYAKLLHPALTLAVVEQYQLTSYWLFSAFEPHFLVLGAAFIELLCGIFFVIGFETRHTSLFIFFWLSASLFFFGESVWPHLSLFGVVIAFFLYGYDRYSLEGRYFKRGSREPVL